MSFRNHSHHHHSSQDDRNSSFKKQADIRKREEEEIIQGYLNEVIREANKYIKEAEETIQKVQGEVKELKGVTVDPDDKAASEFRNFLLTCKDKEIKVADNYIESWERTRDKVTMSDQWWGSLRTAKYIKDYRDRVLNRVSLTQYTNRALSPLLASEHWQLISRDTKDKSFIGTLAIEMQIRALKTIDILGSAQHGIVSRLNELEEENSDLKKRLKRLEDKQGDTDGEQ